MDTRLERLRDQMLATWFPTDGAIFLSDADQDIDVIMDNFFIELLEMFNYDYPALVGKVYSGQDEEAPLILEDIDAALIRLLGITPQIMDLPAGFMGSFRGVTGREFDNNNNTTEVPYMAEQAALELYQSIIVDEYTGRLDNPLLMTNDSGQDFVIPGYQDFIAFILKERSTNIEDVPANLYKAVEAYILWKMAEYVLSVYGRYPVTMALRDLNLPSNTTSTTTTTPGRLSPDRVSSVSFGGKLSVSLSSSFESSYDKVAGLLGSSAGVRYLDQIKETATSNKKIFETLKYIRLGGLQFI